LSISAEIGSFCSVITDQGAERREEEEEALKGLIGKRTIESLEAAEETAKEGRTAKIVDVTEDSAVVRAAIGVESEERNQVEKEMKEESMQRDLEEKPI
ncbi:MAG: hypothetical protein EZS28_051663, partial [Streblomastix strix]